MIACSHCGNELPDGAAFCNQCWRTVAEPYGAAPAPTPPPPGAPVFESPGQPQTATPWEQPTSSWNQQTGSWDQPTGSPDTPWGAAPGQAPPPPPQNGWGVAPMPPNYGGYAPPPYYGAPAAKTNSLAIASLVASISGVACCGIGAIVGVVLGHIALSQIKNTGQEGRGMAVGGLAVGYVLIAGFVIYFAVLFAAGLST